MKSFASVHPILQRDSTADTRTSIFLSRRKGITGNSPLSSPIISRTRTAPSLTHLSSHFRKDTSNGTEPGFSRFPREFIATYRYLGLFSGLSVCSRCFTARSGDTRLSPEWPIAMERPWGWGRSASLMYSSRRGVVKVSETPYYTHTD